MSANPKSYLTPAEYLAQERIATEKSEYWAGEVFAMAGGSESHILITMNASATFHAQLRKRPCKVYTK